jgi:acetyl-CoA C-acetyltransferase
MRTRGALSCSPVRTSVGPPSGALSELPAQKLAAQAIRGLIARSGLAPAAVDEAVLGNCYPAMDAPPIGRVAALDVGLSAFWTTHKHYGRCSATSK